jgi:hypothetical protein
MPVPGSIPSILILLTLSPTSIILGHLNISKFYALLDDSTNISYPYGKITSIGSNSEINKNYSDYNKKIRMFHKNPINKTSSIQKSSTGGKALALNSYKVKLDNWLNKLSRRKNYSKKQLIAFMLVFGIMGSYYVFISTAATSEPIIKEAEQLTILTSGVSAINDSNASAGKAIMFNQKAIASGSIDLPQKIISVTTRAKGDQCGSAPNMIVKINDTVTQNISVTSSSFFDYSTNINLEGSVEPRKISVEFTNPNIQYKGKSNALKCKSNLYVDKLSFVPADTSTTPDTTPPQLVWDVPAEGATVSGQLSETDPANCQAIASDPSGISKVDFYIDGVFLNSEVSAPYSCVIDTTKYPNGTHTFGAKAYDKANNSTEIINRTVAFSNNSSSNTSCTKILNPGADINTEFKNMSAGQTLCLHTGSYGSSASTITLSKSGTSGSPITLTTNPGEAPATIEGEFITDNANYVTISRLNFKQNKVSHPRVNANQGCTSMGVAGIVFWNSNYLTFEYNDVSQGSVSPEYRETAIGINYTSTNTTNVIIHNNKIHDFGACDGYDHGIYTGNTSNGQIYDNWIWNPGCAYGKGGDPSKGCGAGIQLYSNPVNMKVYSNVIDGTGVGFFYYGSGHSVYNNVITNQRGFFYGSSGSYGSPVAYAGAGSTTNTGTFDYNDYFNSGVLCRDCSAASTGNLTTDPLFNNPVAHDYTLKAGSPVAGYGLWNGVR